MLLKEDTESISSHISLANGKNTLAVLQESQLTFMVTHGLSMLLMTSLDGITTNGKNFPEKVLTSLVDQPEKSSSLLLKVSTNGMKATKIGQM